MHAIRKLLTWLFGGAIVGLFIASESVKHYLPWYNQPGQGEQTLCDMGTVTRRILATVYQAQLIGAAVGAGIGIVIAIVLIVRARGKKPGASSPSTPATPTVSAPR